MLQPFDQTKNNLATQKIFSQDTNLDGYIECFPHRGKDKRAAARVSLLLDKPYKYLYGH
jgi:hypothetical protein